MTDRIAAYYDQLAARYGNTPQAVDAPNQEALDVRYEALGDVCDLNDKRVLEVGCGHGGLGAYLTHRYPEINYRGIDISAGLISLGRQAHPELRLYQANLYDLSGSVRYDVVLAQGVLYKLRGWAEVQQMIAALYALAGEVAAFTALTLQSEQGLESAERDDPDLDEEDPGLRGRHIRSLGEYRLDPVRAFAACRRIAPRVSYRNDYRPGDALFALYRKAL